MVKYNRGDQREHLIASLGERCEFMGGVFYLRAIPPTRSGVNQQHAHQYPPIKGYSRSGKRNPQGGSEHITDCELGGKGMGLFRIIALIKAPDNKG